jgi:hypothetical protein
MQNNCLFIGWNRPVNNREGGAVEVIDALKNYFQKQIDDGEIGSFEPVRLNSHAGDLNGFFLVTGAPKSIRTVQQSDDFVELCTKCEYYLEDFGVVAGSYAESFDKMMNNYKKVIQT